MVEIEVTSAQPGLSLHRVTGSATVSVSTGRGMGTALVDAFSLSGGAMLVAGPFTGPPNCYRSGFCTSGINVPMLIAGGVVFASGMGVGFGFAFLQDAPGIRVTY